MARPDCFVKVSDVNGEPAAVTATTYDIEALIHDSYDPKVWRDHLVNDLMKFWMKPEVKSLDGDLFATYITNEGKKLPENEEDWSPEFKAAKNSPVMGSLITPEYNFVRGHSRQTYAYGIAYHMTGNHEYLEMCKKGAEALMNAVDKNHGLYTRQERKSGKWLEPREQRISQDLAYGITGLAMYYFITHDEETLHTILQAKDYIFRTYYDLGRELFTWYPMNRDMGDVEIVAQLDQIYAYMMFLTPALPEPYQTEWKGHLKDIAELLITRFYSERYEFFWGTDNRNDGDDSKQLGTDHTDFGHSIKTMWLIYKIGLLVHETSYVTFAREKMDKILKEAYNTETKSWNRRYNADGSIDQDKEWWILAELDQACEILTLHDPSYLNYLNNTAKYWFDYMVDKKNGEIYHWVNASDNQPNIEYPKVHCWKTSLHSFEHALFGYMTAAEIKGKEFNLYYAFKSKDEVEKTAVPYMFRAKMVKVEADAEAIECMPGENKSFKVTYKALH